MRKGESGVTGNRLDGDFLIEGWLIRPQLNRIEGEGRVIQVQPKVMGVLLCLAAHRGQVLTQEEILRTVWADTHVTRHVLSRAISELRKIFRDNAQSPHIIETIPKAGYRLIGQISIVSEETEKLRTIDAFADPQNSSQPHSRIPSRSSTVSILIRTGAVMVFLVFVLFVFGRLMHQH